MPPGVDSSEMLNSRVYTAWQKSESHHRPPFHGDKELCLTSGGAKQEHRKECYSSEGIVERQKLEVRINTTEVLQPQLCLGPHLLAQQLISLVNKRKASSTNLTQNEQATLGP